VEIIIQFKQREVSIDHMTITVTLVKFISIDITDRVKDYVSPDGIHIPQANLPSGTHTIRISVADIEGMVGVKEFIVEVM